MRSLLFLSILVLSACTYDRLLIYHKDYIVGETKTLRLNGFYNNRDRNLPASTDHTTFIQPIFFYGDGSVIFAGNWIDTTTLGRQIRSNPTGIWGYWGNYNIFNDTIRIETIASYGGSFHHIRKTIVGLVENDQIRLINEIDNKGNSSAVDYVIHFQHFNLKPDSTANWIREKRKFNR